MIPEVSNGAFPRGVLIVASGNVVHNLGGMDWKLTDQGYDWAERFDEDAKTRMLTDPTEFAALDAHRDYRRAVPTPDHFIPALYLAGLAGAADTGADTGDTAAASGAQDIDVLVDGYAYGSLSMTCFTVDSDCSPTADDTRPAAELPDPSLVPPEATNS